MNERPNAVTLKGNSFTLLGPELKVGNPAPQFEVIDKDLKRVELSDTQGKIRIFSVVPSLDTPVCDIQTRRFNKEASSLHDVQIYTVSMDLPFAQSRWCAAAGVDRVTLLSDHREASFGTHYGTLIKELRLNSRAVFVVDQKDTIQHVDYVKEVSEQPNYELALTAVRNLVS